MPTALVTGASSGLGRCVGLDLARDGYDLILVARRDAELETLAGEVRAGFPGREVRVAAGDLTDPAFTAGLVTRFPDVDVLINNAGFGAAGALHQTDWPTYRRMIALNVEATTELTYAFCARMKERGSGTILNVASLAAFGPTPNFAVYAATKSFVLMFSNALNFELRGSGVRVLAYCPGGIATPFNAVASTSAKVRSMGATPESVSRSLIAAMQQGKERAVPGPMYNVFAFFYVHLPLFTRRLVAPLFAR